MIFELILLPLSKAQPLAISGFITIAVGLLVLIFAYLQAKSKEYKKHKFWMKIAVTVNIAFLVQYIIRSAILRQETPFEGPTLVRNFIYIPALTIHITGAIITIFLIAKHVSQSLKYQTQSQTGVPIFEKEYRNQHRSFGKQVFYLWAFTYTGGIIIFLLLYIFY